MSLEARAVAPPSLDIVRMEDRKRPGDADQSPPPAKRQAVTVNGARPNPDADLPWKEDLEEFQKDAILRQMREYKREKTSLEAQLSQAEQRSRYHDDHLRATDLWFDQLLDEIKVVLGEYVSSASHKGPGRTIPASLLFEDTKTFGKHLSDRKDKIISALKDVFAKFPSSSPEVANLQGQITQLLAAEKEHLADVQRIATEKEQISDRLVTATHRYMIAEKKLDRHKSAQVQKLEKQAMANSVVREESPSGGKSAEPVNGVSPAIVTEEVESARAQAVAEAAKRKEHIEQLEAVNKKLTEEVTALNAKFAGLSDDDYAKTDLFKAIKTQYEGVIKRVNDLEATNIQLREDAQKLQAERTAYRIKVDDEARATVSESEGAVVQAEANLARIRHSRDELIAKVDVLESSGKDADTSSQQYKELLSACESRIHALEEKLQRYEKEGLDVAPEEDDLDAMSPETLRSKFRTLDSQCKLLTGELDSMGSAWKKAQALATRKISEIAKWEENVVKANADKAKADQKYFAAMKAKETLEQQLRVLRAQAVKGTEVVSQLKEADSLSRSMVEKLEKQVAEMAVQMDELSTQHRMLQQKVNEEAILSDNRVSRIAELTKLLETKDASTLAAKKAQREAEVDSVKYAEQIRTLEKQIEHWREKSMGNQNAHAAMMETMLQCQICKNKIKDTVIKTCGHLFCDQCVQDRLVNRARKCPNCGKAFGNNDVMRVHL